MTSEMTGNLSGNHLTVSALRCTKAAWTYPQVLNGPVRIQNEFLFSFFDQEESFVLAVTTFTMKVIEESSRKEIGYCKLEILLIVETVDQRKLEEIKVSDELTRNFIEHCASISVGHVRTLVLQSSMGANPDLQIIIPPFTQQQYNEIQIDHVKSDVDEGFAQI
jgi:hypothetical protein